MRFCLTKTKLTMLLTKLSAWTACYSNNCLSSFATLVSYLTKNKWFGQLLLLMMKLLTYNNPSNGNKDEKLEVVYDAHGAVTNLTIPKFL